MGEKMRVLSNTERGLGEAYGRTLYKTEACLPQARSTPRCLFEKDIGHIVLHGILTPGSHIQSVVDLTSVQVTYHLPRTYVLIRAFVYSLESGKSKMKFNLDTTHQLKIKKHFYIEKKKEITYLIIAKIRILKIGET